MRNFYGNMLALAAASLMAVDDRIDLGREPEFHPRPKRKFKLAPTSGPVIDTTRESKRARRRRLAREGGNADG